MSETRDFTIGREVVCSDGVCGELRRVVVDPVARALTHLVVEPRHPRRAGHLVPIEFVDSTASEIRLRCTMAEFEALEDAEETHFLPGASRHWGYEQGQMLSWPYYALRMGGGMGMGALGIGGGMGTGGLGMGGMVPVPEQSSLTAYPWARSRCAAASTCTQRMGRSDGSRGWSSIPAIIT
jgi:hypothetical protein